MNCYFTINEHLTLEVCVGATGTAVCETRSSGSGSVSNKQVFWNESEAAARAFVAGVEYMAAQNN